MQQRQPLSGLQPPQIHQIWQQLQQIPDPELPALSITDLGMIRNVLATSNGWKVLFTPTYSGCPATEFLLNEIKHVLGRAGFSHIEIEVVLTPAWTTDWMNQNAKQRLRDFGIAPPAGKSCEHPEQSEQSGPIHCPRCDSQQTEKISEFGSTACKALYRCCECFEPFDYFKCI